MSMEALTVFAIVLAPVFALQVDGLLDRWRERRRRKLDVFHTLMATRGARLAPIHVEALNRIDFAFYGDTAVIDSWKVYFDHLNTANADQGRWQDDGTKLFTELLAEMATSLNYDFDSLVLKKGGYFPMGYGETELDQFAIRKATRNLLEGKQPLKVAVEQTAHEQN